MNIYKKRGGVMKSIKITAGTVTLFAELNDSQTADAIWNALPFKGVANTWGDEIYFEIPVEIDKEPDARAEVAVGELGYWPSGEAFCIFFGPTPISSGSRPQAASLVNIFGNVVGDATQFRSTENGDVVLVEKE